MGENTCSVSGLDRFFKPTSIAVIGASSDPRKLGYKLVKNIVDGGFKGAVHPINIRGGDVYGRRSAASLDDIEGEIDLAMISLPSGLVKDALVECGKKEVPFAIIVSAGFREVGNIEGERELLEIARSYGTRLLGPNVFGIIYTPRSLNAQFGPGDVMKGRVAIITQSGALGAALMGKVFEEGIGVSGVVSTGNKADISDEELLEFFCSDPNTDAILMYIEGLKDGRQFMETVSGVSAMKPIIVVKSGSTEEGARAVASHTASLAGSDRVFTGAFRQAGVIRAPNMKDAIDWTRALIDLPLPRRKNVLIITNGGGLGAIAVDKLTELGIPLFKDMDWIKDEMGPIFPSYATMANPVDITAQVPYDIYLKGLGRAIDEESIGSVMGIYAPTSGADMEDFTELMIETIGKPSKPVLICTFGGRASMLQIQELKKNGIPAFYYPEETVSSLGILYRFSEMKERKEGKQEKNAKWDISAVGKRLEGNKAGFMDASSSLELLETGPVVCAERRQVRTEKEVMEASEKMGYPLVLKVSSSDLIHKTESKGVSMNISCKEELLSEFRRLRMLSDAVMVQEQVMGTELIAGALRDPVFGPVVMFGLGGVLVEALEDVQFRVAPLTRDDAFDMIDSIKGRKLLEGFRGAPPVSREELASILRSLGELLLEVEEIVEIEINPLIASENGLLAVDARVKLR
ncbi:MAG: acetate--CoA ligase family protein [Thermoplasmatota archaeon]